MGKLILLIIIGLAVGMYFPDSRAVIMDKGEPVLRPMLVWNAQREIEKIVLQVQQNEQVELRLSSRRQGRSEQPHFGRNAIGCGSKIRLRRPIGAMKCWLARRINGPNRQEVASMCPAPALARPMGAWAPRYPVA